MFDAIIMDIIRNKNWHTLLKKIIFFLHRLKTKSFICTGVTSRFLLEKRTYECLEVPCVYLHSFLTDMKHYLTHILKSDTSSGDMNEKVDHWLDSFEKFHKKYIIMPSQSLNSSFLEESFYHCSITTRFH